MKEFKLIVAGGRDFNDYGRLHDAIISLAHNELKDFAVSIVSGMAKGADAMGAKFANTNGITLHKFPADWEAYGKRAGFMRNAQMGTFADGLLAFWDGKSRGTQHMIQCMEQAGKPVRVINY